MKYIKRYEQKQTNRGLVKELQDYLTSIQPKCGWCPLEMRFVEGVQDVSGRINKSYTVKPLIIPNKKYNITLATKEEVKGWFIISGEYLVNEEVDKPRFNQRGNIDSYALLYTPYDFLQLLKFANKEDIDKIKIEMDINKYNI